MIRILHLTDFHLNLKTQADWNDYIKESLITQLQILHEENPINLVAFTGDLIDQGGREFKSASNAFSIFKTEIITPILEALHLPVSNFIISCGNHDIVRNADKLIDESGCRAHLKTASTINEFIDDAIKENDYSNIKRIKDYKKFEYELYKGVSGRLQSIFESSFLFEINGKKVGVSSLNSSWRCYDDGDSGRLLIGETQLVRNTKFLKGCDIKIALCHHPLDWISSAERKTITYHMSKDFNVILSGHVHESATSVNTGFVGTTFFNISPSGLNDIRTDSKTYSNGFTIVDICDDSITCGYWRYNHDQKAFLSNTDLGENGIFKYLVPTKQSHESETGIITALKNITEDHFETMDKHFIGVKDENVKPTVKNNFIFPPIDKGKSFYSDDDTELTFQEIAKNAESMMFFGVQESGKTSLLYRLVVEFVEEFTLIKKLPVYIDFQELGNKDLITAIKEYTRLSSHAVKSLIAENRIVLLIDNLSYQQIQTAPDKINKLHNFKRENSSIQIIATCEHEAIGIIPPEYIEHCKIGFTPYFIRGLKAREIKSIMKKWLPEDDELQADEKLEKLVNTFSSYSLPNTAMSVNLYLWSLENKERKPINHAVLMEIYIEIILEKLNKRNIYRDSFDFKNKVQLISVIAEEMLRKDKLHYALSEAEFTFIIEDYIKNKVGFSFDTAVIREYLLDRKVFIRKNGGNIQFPHLCFFHFFIAKRMEGNAEFRDYILHEDNYFKFPKELDYYSGLVRSDLDLFKKIFARFEDLFKSMDFILEKVDVDDYFNVKPQEGKEIEPDARNVEIAKIKDNRPTEAKVEKHYNKQLERISNQGITNKTGEILNFDRLLLIMCNVLRNSEGIEDLQLKNDAYRSIIKYNLAYSILYSQVVIRYVLEHKKLPPSIPAFITLKEILNNFPYHIQYSLYTHLGTSKLSNIVLSKINEDKHGKSVTKSEIEAFLSVGIYSDIQGPNFDKELRLFVKSVKKLPVQNYLLYKLMKYFYKRTKAGSPTEELYLDLIADLKIRTQKLPKRVKQSIIKSFNDRKKSLGRLL